VLFSILYCNKNGAKITLKIVFPHSLTSILFFIDLNKIIQLHNEIDAFDYLILDLLIRRFTFSKEIGDIKAIYRLNETDRNPEQDNIDRPVGKLDRNNISLNFIRFITLQKNNLSLSSVHPLP